MLKNGAAIPRYDKVAISVVGLNTGTAGGFARELSDEPCHFSVSFLRLSEKEMARLSLMLPYSVVDLQSLYPYNVNLE